MTFVGIKLDVIIVILDSRLLAFMKVDQQRFKF